MKKLLTLLVPPLVLIIIGIAASQVEYKAFLPLVYCDTCSTPAPTATRTPKPTVIPTPTPTIVPGELWVWVIGATLDGTNTKAYAVVPGINYELDAVKSGKTIYVRAVCPKGETCVPEQAPPEYPPPCEFWPGGRWCQVEKLIFEASSKQVCGAQYPLNCKDVK